MILWRHKHAKHKHANTQNTITGWRAVDERFINGTAVLAADQWTDAILSLRSLFMQSMSRNPSVEHKTRTHHGRDETVRRTAAGRSGAGRGGAGQVWTVASRRTHETTVHIAPQGTEDEHSGRLFGCANKRNPA